MQTLTFTGDRDSYVVAAADSYEITFLAGDDTLTTNHVDATTVADMGEGADVVIHRTGTVDVFGGPGNDRFEIYASGFTADGGSDNDLFNFRGGAGPTVEGGEGNDRFNFAAAATDMLLRGGAGDDDFAGYDHASTGEVHGGEGDDLFTGFRAGVTIHGEGGNDSYRVNPGSNATFVELSGEGADTVHLMRGADYILPDNIEAVVIATYPGSDQSNATVTGNALANDFRGHGNAETFFGLGGNDRIFAKGGDDVLDGGDGNDVLDGGGGNDILTGGAGNDRLVGRTGNDAMTGGTGNDLYYVDSAGDLVTELPGGGTDTIRTAISMLGLPANIENGVLESSVDGLELWGNDLGNRLWGRAGDDSLHGAAGDDVLDGGAGNDMLYGGTGADWMAGGSENDIYFVDDASDIVVEEWAEGYDTVRVSIAEYALGSDLENGVLLAPGTLAGNEAPNGLTGSSGADLLAGHGGDDALSGYDGEDQIQGGAGNDYINGGGDDDVLNGGEGSDILVGDHGADSLYGGLGRDTFRYGHELQSTIANPDLIQDFVSGTDWIDLSAIDANTTVEHNQSFSHVILTPTGQPGQWWYTWDGTYSHLYADVDGGGADFRIDIVGQISPDDIIG